MTLTLYQEVAVIQDIPESDLKTDDVAMLVDFVDHPHGGEQGAFLEVFNAVGETIAVVIVPVSAIVPLRADQVPTVRSLQKAA
ncbi:MAG: DUF4926 domain-containing protein [Chloroflexi bacterium]|nr:DUF4926 domain-containing protein [Chloroflexota bacterium]